MSKKIAIKICVFLSVLGVLLVRLNTIFVLKEYPMMGQSVNTLVSPYTLCDRLDGFYSLQKNSLDVVFVGSSNIHCNINPNIIWHEYGITSYDFSSDKQELGTTFYYLQQVFKTQSPKVVFVDVRGSGEEMPIETSAAHFAFDHMTNDLIRVCGIWNRTTEARMELLFPIIAYHERWKELKKSDLQYRSSRQDTFSGAEIFLASAEKEKPILPKQIPEKDIPEQTAAWIDKISALCSDHDCECVFMKTPYSFYDDDIYGYCDSVSRYCSDNNLQFIFFNRIIDETGLSFESDYLDEEHLNWYGQQKLSRYFGDYLTENHHFSDKDEVLSSEWDKKYSTMVYYVDSLAKSQNEEP